MSKTSILIPSTPGGQDAAVRLNVNGIGVIVSRDVPTPLDEPFLLALQATDICFEILPMADDSAGPEEQDPEAPQGDAGGGGAEQGGAAADNPAGTDGATTDTALLDRPVKEIVPALAALDLSSLEALLAAEQSGKTRASLIPEIVAAIALRKAD